MERSNENSEPLFSYSTNTFVPYADLGPGECDIVTCDKIDGWPLNKYLFSTYYGPSIVLGAWDKIVGKIEINACSKC